ncbi:RagB/SusD family nutrient uptake outer membrane protein [Pseudoflavitalea sp. G-6-1-2]|uniref:RagB/SusD family nutrient uptake outer membrane protein n=1 Tax=Pseudoflavitalea sp. G-6-1-2 TaxID=2728841 RepID=UPI00146D8FFA|nr:RagB/SusD family nutrient uptake outer membrane protein [Pseudoflavitalea sp. G-6-1-2]NML21347.1 RagB/SusD family nutrient uptake outer membrane protein [Pseudoflavitalea sp. G-6-1-2]
MSQIKNILLLLLVCCMAACGKLLDNPLPNDKVSVAQITDAEIPLLIRGIYQQSTANAFYLFYVLQDIMADDVQGTGYIDFENNNIPNTSSNASSAYVNPFKGILSANQVIRYIEDNKKEGTLGTALGEAKFMRAYNYYRLVQHFGGVAIVNGREPMNAKPFRNTEEEVYNEIVKDLNTAIGNLGDYNGNSLLPSKQAAQALLARVYLWQGKYAEARKLAMDVIDAGKNQLDADFGSMFNDNTTSKELIWRQTETSDNAVANGLAVVYGPGPVAQGKPGSNNIWIDSNLVKKFDAADKRKLYFYDSTAASVGKKVFFLTKFKVSPRLNPNYPILRLSEMHLIVAEADARNNIVNLTYLNTVRLQRGAVPADAASITSPQEMIDAVELERRKEFVGEGLRWYDMRRLNKAIPWLDSKLKPKGFQLLPIPFQEIFLNPNTAPNPDYN